MGVDSSYVLGCRHAVNNFRKQAASGHCIGHFPVDCSVHGCQHLKLIKDLNENEIICILPVSDKLWDVNHNLGLFITSGVVRSNFSRHCFGFCFQLRLLSYFSDYWLPCFGFTSGLFDQRQFNLCVAYLPFATDSIRAHNPRVTRKGHSRPNVLHFFHSSDIDCKSTESFSTL